MQAQATLTNGDAPAKKERNRLYPSAGIALAAELVLLGGMWFWFTRPHPPAPPPPVTLALAPVQQAKPVPPTPKPKPKEIPKPVHHVVQHVVQHTPPPKPVEPKPIPTPIPTPDPVPVPVPKPPPPAPQPPAPSRPDASFEARMREAIQAAVRYPEAARMSNLDGHPVVGFTYRDGVVSNVHLVRSSGSSVIDAAGVAAVRDAAMPMPPKGLAGRSFNETIRVDFTLEDSE